MDWRKATLSHLALWRRTIAASPVSKTNGHSGFRSESTVGLWMVAVRSFYEWADAHSLLATDVVSRMTELKYFAPGTAGGGEHGAMRRVLVEELRSKRVEAPAPRWISDASARNRLAELMLPTRDRFLIDLLTTSGIRIGEALSLFVADLHFGGGSQQFPKGKRQPLWWTSRMPARPLTYHAVHRMFERVNDRAGTAATLHSLRHTAAYRMAEDPRLPLTDVQLVLGHAQLTTTQIYLTPRQEDVVRRVLTHHDEQARCAAARSRPAPAPGYRPESLDVLFGGRV